MTILQQQVFKTDLFYDNTKFWISAKQFASLCDSNIGSVPNDHCVVYCHRSNMDKIKKQCEHWRGILSCN